MDQNSPEFKALQKKWYKKLEKSGFEDAERPDGNLKWWASRFDRKWYNPTADAAKEAYYRFAGQFLHGHTFEDPMEREIWALHSEGVSMRNIVKTLRKRYRGIYVLKTNDIIKRLSAQMLKENIREEK